MMKESAEQIVAGAFKTVFIRGDYEQVRKAHWDDYRAGQRLFLNRSIEAYNQELVEVVFYSGFKAKTVTGRKNAILGILGDPRRSAGYSESDIPGIMDADGMIRNRRKIRACISNSRMLLELDRTFGTFNGYLRSFSDHFPDDKEGMLRLLEDLKAKFDLIGPRTGRHFLMNIGFPLIKPDVMVMRVLFRLGMISGESGEYIDQAVDVCLEMARLTDIPPRFLDELLVKVGQSEGAEVCKKREPICSRCGLRPYCRYPS